MTLIQYLLIFLSCLTIGIAVLGFQVTVSGLSMNVPMSATSSFEFQFLHSITSCMAQPKSVVVKRISISLGVFESLPGSGLS